MKQNNYYYRYRHRRFNREGTREDFQHLLQMFPPQGIYPYSYEAVTALKRYFNPKKHMHYLIHQCYKNHYNSIRIVYESFRQQFYPQVKEPKLSLYYDNQSFISMAQLTAWFKVGKEQNYPSYHKKGDPNKIIDGLDQVHEQLNYIPNLQRFYFFYPEHLWNFCRYRYYLFDPRVIDTKVAYFLVIIVAIEMGCPYMLSRASSAFLIHGGPEEWVLKNQYPKYLQTLFPFIRKACKAPWQISQQDHKYLKENYWADDDLLLHQHCIVWGISECTVALGMGLLPDQPCQLFDIDKILEIKGKYDSILYETNPDKKKMIQQFRQFIESHDDIGSKDIHELQKKQVGQYMKQIGKELQEQKIYEQIHENVHGIYNQKFIKTQKRKEDKYPVLQLDDNYFGRVISPQLLYYLGEKIGKSCESLIQYPIIMTSQNFGKSQSNTSAFRKSIRYLVQNLLGLKHSKYNYKKQIKMNIEASLSLRFYIRLLVLHPVYIKRQVIDQINHQQGRAQMFDLGHLAVLAAYVKARIIIMHMYNYMYCRPYF